MHEYHLNVLQDGGTKQRLYVVQSGVPIDSRLLLVAGLLIDGGYDPEEIEPLLANAQSYVGIVSAAFESDYWVTVCDKCLCSSCWHGEFMCQESQNAGTKEMKASELVLAGLENPEHFSREKIRQVSGSDPSSA